MTTLPGLRLELPASWGVATLAEVTSKIGSGATPRGGNSVYVASGPALIRSQNIHDHEFKPEGLAFLSQEAAAALRGVTVESGDVLINITGDSILRTAIVPESVLPARVNQHVAIVRSNGRVDPGFLQKWLSLPLMKEYMLGHSSGGTRKAITKGHLQSFPIPLPPLAEQRAIAATLGALDDKIESNRRATAVGESLIRALVESALDGSEGADGTLGDYCRLVKAPVKVEEISADDNYIGLERMPRGSIFLTEWEKAEGLGSNKTAFRRGDVLFGKLRPYFKKVGIAPVNGVCSTDILAVRPKDPRDLALIAVVAASDALIDSLSAGSTGTRMPRASWKDLAAWQVPVLTSTERAELSDRVAPLVERLEQLTFESRRLTALRDALLPELLSGRIRVPAEGVAA